MSRTWILLLAVVALVAAPFLLRADAEFEGVDAQAQALALASRPGYEPWAAALWEPPSGEVQAFLFALQAGLGGGFMGYGFGVLRARRKEAS